ncbi:hypothetical protein HPB49_003249 [Dermacentor silvarum]|uniref:Uncharacterized protein n=1 Tax=Dermacentor silvarum TaxID=543639 RepID=A0ACB8C1Y1_DERSI|nr:hypothetical protein HPB49_003249 [Dermacentor silvarum]
MQTSNSLSFFMQNGHGSTSPAPALKPVLGQAKRKAPPPESTEAAAELLQEAPASASTTAATIAKVSLAELLDRLAETIRTQSGAIEQQSETTKKQSEAIATLSRRMGIMEAKVADVTRLKVVVAKWIVHNHIRKTQGKAIYDEKQCTQRGSIVFHFDFAENWTVVLPDEVQAYHWQKQQVSVLKCVVTTKKSTESFAIVSEDLNHDSAHACLALKKATKWVEDNLPVYSKVTYVSDGAASHFKNRYRLYEFGKSDCPNTQWIFSATAHGKNACDGVEGLVKHQAMLNNLRTSPESAIRAARDFVTTLTEKLKGVHLMHLEEKEVDAFRDLKKNEWMKVPAFHGIQSWHAWQLSRSTEASPELYVARIAGSGWKKLCVQE